jgi:hypothetical protein
MQHHATFQGIARSLVVVAVALTLVLPFAMPVLADTAGQRSTRNILIGAAVATAAVILYNNYHHKQVAHNTIVGYTRDGGTVYADGRIVYPDGTVVYAGKNGAPCAWDGSQRYYCGNTATYTPRNNGGDADEANNDVNNNGNYNGNRNGNYNPNYGYQYGNYPYNNPNFKPNQNGNYYADNSRYTDNNGAGDQRGRHHGNGGQGNRGHDQ